MIQHTYLSTVEKWGVQEIVCPGRTEGNPFLDADIKGVFVSDEEQVEVTGFYDGEGRYVVRFMPSFEGEYTFRVWGSFSEEVYTGFFTVTAPAKDNHGPVRVSQKYHFAYEDGTRYIPVGTTCYVWQLQSPEMFERTLETLAHSPFNKIRFCVFPKHYNYNLNEPYTYPYEGTPCDSSWLHAGNFHEADGRCEGNDWDFTRFNPAHFRHLEKAITRLGEIGIEADIIVMHPYDRWGFSMMTREEDQRYFKYLACRISAYRNVWWSLANEYDLLREKTEEDWEGCAATLNQYDPYHHLMSIHNCGPFYDHTRPWVTHCCIQRQDTYRTTEYVDEWREKYGKPVIVDEMGYEGNIQFGWGNLSGEEITRRFWEASLRGGYGGHGETFLHEKGILWWSHGDVLHGKSPERLQFMYDVLAGMPGPLKRAKGLRHWEGWDEVQAVAEDDDPLDPKVALYYYSFMQPSFRTFKKPEGQKYHYEVIDTWNMTRTDAGVHAGRVDIPLPARSYMAILVTKVEG